MKEIELMVCGADCIDCEDPSGRCYVGYSIYDMMLYCIIYISLDYLVL